MAEFGPQNPHPTFLREQANYAAFGNPETQREEVGEFNVTPTLTQMTGGTRPSKDSFLDKYGLALFTGALTGGAMAAGAGGGSAAAGGAAAGSEAALGSGISPSAGAGATMGTGGYEALGLGSGITPGVASEGIGAGAAGSGIAPGVQGGLGALGAYNFSPASMQAINGGYSPQITSAQASGAGTTSAGQGLRVPEATSAGGAGAAPGGGGTGTAAGAGGQQSFTDQLIQQMRQNALSLGLMGAGTALTLSAGQKEMPNQQQMQGLGTEAAATAQQLMQQYRSGALSPGQQAGLDQLIQNTKNQLRQYFASTGQADSTAAAQAMAQVDQQGMMMKQQMLDSALQQGLSAIGVAQGPLNTIAQYQLGQDNALRQAFGNFAMGAGMMAGRSAGTQPPQAPRPTQTQTQTPNP